MTPVRWWRLPRAVADLAGRIGDLERRVEALEQGRPVIIAYPAKQPVSVSRPGRTVKGARACARTSEHSFDLARLSVLAVLRWVAWQASPISTAPLTASHVERSLG
jgi:hypothetical protein